MYLYNRSGSAAFLIICMLLALTATVLICVFILPQKRRAQLTGFFAKMHEFVNFNVLIIEKLLKILYILCTCVTVFMGVFVLFSINALTGILIIVAGSVLVRVGYEMSMLMIIGVNNLVQLNKKIPCGTGRTGAQAALPYEQAARYAQSYTPPAAPAQPYEQPVQPGYAPPAAAPRMIYCTQCGTRYDANRGGCPNCGAPGN